MIDNKGSHHYNVIAGIKECQHTIILMKRISFQPTLLVLSLPKRHSTYLNLTAS